MDPSFVVVRTMSSIIWMIVAVLLAVVLVFVIVALVNLIGILKSAKKITGVLEHKTTLVNKFIDDIFGFVVQKVTAFFKEKKEPEKSDF